MITDINPIQPENGRGCKISIWYWFILTVSHTHTAQFDDSSTKSYKNKDTILYNSIVGMSMGGGLGPQKN